MAEEATPDEAVFVELAVFVDVVALAGVVPFVIDDWKAGKVKQAIRKETSNQSRKRVTRRL